MVMLPGGLPRLPNVAEGASSVSNLGRLAARSSRRQATGTRVAAPLHYRRAEHAKFTPLAVLVGDARWGTGPELSVDTVGCLQLVGRRGPLCSSCGLFRALSDTAFLTSLPAAPSRGRLQRPLPKPVWRRGQQQQQRRQHRARPQQPAWHKPARSPDAAGGREPACHAPAPWQLPTRHTGQQGTGQAHLHTGPQPRHLAPRPGAARVAAGERAPAG